MMMTKAKFVATSAVSKFHIVVRLRNQFAANDEVIYKAIPTKLTLC